MPRLTRIAAAQVGGIQPDESRQHVVRRLVALLEQAASQACTLIVFPELTLTTFFPRYWLEEREDALVYFETEMPSADTAPLFERARELGVAVVLGYAELTQEGRRFNTVIAVDTDGSVGGYYRKIHLPGHADDRQLEHQHLEKYYFEVGEEGFPVVDLAGLRVGLATCNDRRWAETYRVMALQGADVAAIGYNTPYSGVPRMEPEPHRMMSEHLLSVRAGAYQNSMWVVAAGKSGVEDGQRLIGGSCVVAPTGDVVSVAMTDRDELVVATYDPSVAEPYRAELFNFAKHRRPEHYRLIAERTAAGASVVDPTGARS